MFVLVAEVPISSFSLVGPSTASDHDYTAELLRNYSGGSLAGTVPEDRQPESRMVPATWSLLRRL